MSPPAREPPSPGWLRFAWFLALWAGGVASVAAVAYALRLAIR